MKAVRVTGPGTVELATLPRPRPDESEVVVAVEAAAICGTDRKLVRRGEPAGRVLGHEGAGRLPDGTLVGIHPDTGCGRCTACRDGRTNRCPDHVAVGIDRDGCLAEAVTVPAAHAVPLDGVALELAPLAEPLACCVHALDRATTRRLSPGTAVVVGAGAMGVLMGWTLAAAGWSVVVNQRSQPRRDLARDLGLPVLGPDDDPAEAFDGPPDLVMVTAPGTEALSWALEEVAEGGTVHAFAGTPDGAPIDANLVHYRHLDLVGSTGSGLTDYREALALIRDGDVPVETLPRDITDLSGVVNAVTRHADETILRTIVRSKEPTR